MTLKQRYGNGGPVKPQPRPTTKDSLDLYNNSLKIRDYYRKKGYVVNFRRNLHPELAKEFVNNEIYSEDAIKTENKDKFMEKAAVETDAPMVLYDRRIAPVVQTSYKDPKTGNSFYSHLEYAKPRGTTVPKVERYIPTERNLKPSVVRGLNKRAPIEVEGNGYTSTDLSPQPTSFSATYRDESLPGKQQTLYFADREKWKGFLGTGALSGVDTSETGNEAHATGYRAYGSGGQLNGGGTPIPKTRLSPAQDSTYQAWRSQLPQPLQYEGDYDLRRLWLENPGIKPSANMHFPDRYKLPNHPTFSNESMYFNPTNQYMAGHWVETDSSWNYTPYNDRYKKLISERKRFGGRLIKPFA